MFEDRSTGGRGSWNVCNKEKLFHSMMNGSSTDVCVCEVDASNRNKRKSFSMKNYFETMEHCSTQRQFEANK